uniref:Uncharacterized protein n=1 Tax=Glossina austeni TaxID=7395 RepID=A0A1A9UUC1_GLOAU
MNEQGHDVEQESRYLSRRMQTSCISVFVAANIAAAAAAAAAALVHRVDEEIQFNQTLQLNSRHLQLKQALKIRRRYTGNILYGHVLAKTSLEVDFSYGRSEDFF